MLELSDRTVKNIINRNRWAWNSFELRFLYTNSWVEVFRELVQTFQNTPKNKIDILTTVKDHITDSHLSLYIMLSETAKM